MLIVDTLALILILISPAVGSFIAVLVDRLVRGEDVIVTASRCRTCKHRLGATDLFPLLSYSLQKGRCRYCHGHIPPFVFYCEILGLGAAVLAVLGGGGTTQIILSALWLWVLVALAVTDAVWMRLPDPLTASAFTLALVMAVHPTGAGLADALWGAIWGAGSFAVLRWVYHRMRGRVGLGLGDIKLMAGLGAFCGPYAIPQLVLIASFAALTTALLTRTTSPEGLSGTRALPFGTALCFSAALIWLWRAGG